MGSARIQAHPGLLGACCRFDGTLASDSRVGQSTIDALKKWVDSGRRLILVTVRQLEELLRVFPDADLFDWVVAAWCYHLRRGDFAQWIESTVNNETLAGLVRELEGKDCPELDLKEQIIEAIRSEYTLPE